VLAALLVIAVGGCAMAPYAPRDPALHANPLPGSVLRSAKIDRELEERILALDPEKISDTDVRGTLAKGPTPRIFAMHGGVYPVYLLMESFAQFLIGMGYPEERIRDAGDGAYSHSPYESSEMEAGLIAWYYEHEGARPILVGHSQGGIQAVKILHELAGSFGSELHPFNPLTGEYESRTTILDPLSGRERPVVGVSVASASVVGTGGLALALPMHWGALGLIRSIPDTVDEFTGYRIGLDIFAWDFPGLEGLKTFHAAGKAHVRNVTLPAEYSHVFVPVTAQLTEDPAMRAWINAYDPEDEAGRAPLPQSDSSNVLFAADVWHTIKRHWAREAQRFVRASRAMQGGS
jgi:pimeloyl-ACP methyl ester carboxylesterase